jgi:HKD family nuclease
MEHPAGHLFDGKELNEKIAQLLPQAKKEVIFISAYITQSAIEWLINLQPENVKTHIICRLTPSDVMSGATHLSALKTAIRRGVKVSCLHSLHAKIYAIDNKSIFVGSANLTNNGLKIYGNGNLEACSEVPANKANIDFIGNIVRSSTNLDEEIIQNMQGCIDLKETSVFLDSWPEGVLKEEEGVWVRDFFWTSPDIEKNSPEQIHDFELMGVDSLASADEITEDVLLKTRCIKWLIRKLEAQSENELYFGSLTKILHDELKDDPAPYRKDIKGLVQNLLVYCDRYLSGMIEISRPNHSQRIKLKKAH